jgi:deoxyribonuclease V
MRVHRLHDWHVTPAQGLEIQRSLAGRVSAENAIDSPRLIAGVDISAVDSRGEAVGAIVVMSYPELTKVEVQVVRQKVDFPYVPGLLSFRECPLILAACENLASTPDVLLVDGQGIAHPRRFGLACHLGVLLDMPAIGCAKSRLFGKHGVVQKRVGDFAQLLDGDEVIGVALCTKDKCNPLYVSIGHKVDIPGAIYWTLQCCQGRRIPEPLRLAHLEAGGKFQGIKGFSQERQGLQSGLL